jgi:two-component system chemotaxis response regulator CheY
VADGQAAWQVLGTQTFDLFITDDDMPRMTGVQLIAKLRLSKVTVPVILASGSADLFRGEEYRWLNICACLQKPFTPDDLLKTVASALRCIAASASRNEPFSFTSDDGNLPPEPH